MTRCTRCIIVRWPATWTVDGELLCLEHMRAVVDALTREARVAPLPPAPKEVPA